MIEASNLVEHQRYRVKALHQHGQQQLTMSTDIKTPVGSLKQTHTEALLEQLNLVANSTMRDR